MFNTFEPVVKSVTVQLLLAITFIMNMHRNTNLKLALKTNEGPIKFSSKFTMTKPLSSLDCQTKEKSYVKTQEICYTSIIIWKLKDKWLSNRNLNNYFP